MIEFCNKLVQLRKEKGYTQEDLANILHVSRQTVSKWERNASYPSYDLLTAIAKEFDTSIDELITGEDVRAMAIVSSDKVRKNGKITLIIATALIVILALSLVGTIVAFTIKNDVSDWENNNPIINVTPNIVCGAVFVMGKREDDIFTDGEEFDLEKVEQSGFPYCINMIMRGENESAYSALNLNGMFGESVNFNGRSWSGEFQIYYTKAMYMNIYLIAVDDEGTLRLDNRLSFTYLRAFPPAKLTITLNSNYYPKQNESFDANAANGVKIQFVYKNEIRSFSVEERTKDGELIKNTECVSLEDIASLTEDIYYLDKRTAFIVINEKYIKDGQEAVNELIITKTECESVYTYPILNTYDKGYATLAAHFACSR